MLAVGVAAAASVVAAAAFTGAGSVAVAAIVVGCVRHILSQAARVVPDMDTPVVRATRSQAEVTIEDTAGLHWEPQRLVLRPMALMALTTTATMRTAIGSVPISTNIDAHRAHPTAAGSALTAVPSSDICRLRVAQATTLTELLMSRVGLVTEFEVYR